MAVSRITIARDGPAFSRIVQGFGSAVRWNKTPRQILEYITECLDLGITTFDVAAIYGEGQAEALLGAALAESPGLRDRVELVTKCGIGTWGTSLYHYDTSTAHILWSADQSLARLKTDHIDVLLLHRADPLLDADQVAEAFTRLRQAGKVLHFGVSNFTPSQFELLASRLDLPLVTDEIQFSVLYLDTWYDGTLDMCQRLRISPLAWSPLGGGRLFKEDTGQAVRLRQELERIGESLGAAVDQVALAWLLRHPARIIPILGTGKAERVRSAAGTESLELNREQWFRVWVASTGSRLP